MKKLIKLALLVGGVAFVAKMLSAKKAEWQGMTEGQVRDKLDAKLGARVPDEKREMIAEKVVAKMREKGVLADEAPSSDAAETTDDAAGEADETDEAPADDTTSS